MMTGVAGASKVPVICGSAGLISGPRICATLRARLTRHWVVSASPCAERLPKLLLVAKDRRPDRDFERVKVDGCVFGSDNEEGPVKFFTSKLLVLTFLGLCDTLKTSSRLGEVSGPDGNKNSGGILVSPKCRISFDMLAFLRWVSWNVSSARDEASNPAEQGISGCDLWGVASAEVPGKDDVDSDAERARATLALGAGVLRPSRSLAL